MEHIVQGREVSASSPQKAYLRMLASVRHLVVSSRFDVSLRSVCMRCLKALIWKAGG